MDSEKGKSKVHIVKSQLLACNNKAYLCGLKKAEMLGPLSFHWHTSGHLRKAYSFGMPMERDGRRLVKPDEEISSDPDSKPAASLFTLSADVLDFQSNLAVGGRW